MSNGEAAEFPPPLRWRQAVVHCSLLLVLCRSFTGPWMPMSYDTYQHPLTGRYAAKEMRELFSDRRRFGLWRQLWLALAESERELGLAQISDEALKQMRANLQPTDDQLKQ